MNPVDGQGATFAEEGNLYQREMRLSGWPVSQRKLILTTVLVNGLEYDHAVILDVDADALDAKDLYVAMTQGSRSLTIIGTGRHLPAKVLVQVSVRFHCCSGGLIPRASHRVAARWRQKIGQIHYVPWRDSFNSQAICA